MTRQQAIEYFNKLGVINYNDRKNKEYAAGMSNAYSRAHRLLRGTPSFSSKEKEAIGEETPYIIALLEKDKALTKGYAMDCLSSYLSGKTTNPTEVIDRITYYLGRVNGGKAALSIVKRIKE